MAASSGGIEKDYGKLTSAKQFLTHATKFHHHPPKITITKEFWDIDQKDITNREKIFVDNDLPRGPHGTRRRSLSDSDMLLLSPKLQNSRTLFEFKNSGNVVKDFTLYEEEEEAEDEENDILNMSGFILYDEGAGMESVETGCTGEEGFYVNAILPNGERVKLYGQDGMRIRDLIATLIAEKKVGPSPRVKLAIHRVPINEDADASMLHKETIVLENRDAERPIEALDRRHEILLKMLSSEREYHDLIQSAIIIYHQPVQKLSSLCNSDSKFLFDGLQPLLKLSTTLIEQFTANSDVAGGGRVVPPYPSVKFEPLLEISVSNWDLGTTEIGHLFHKDFWLEYGKYYTNYKMAKLLLLYLRQHNNEFVATCKNLRGAARHSLDSLLLLPVQRVSQYDKYINELYNRTPPHHTDADNLKEAAGTVRSMVKDREDEVGHAENENKLQQVQDRFPSDDLQLAEKDMPKAEKFKAAAAARRRSAPTTVLRSAFNKAKANERSGLVPSASFTDQQSLANMDLSGGRSSPTLWSNNNNRQYIMEAPVQSTTGVQTQCRYLFLFNDLLIIAKPNKSGSTFRLKHRLRVSELWMATCIEDVCEMSRPADCSFVLGWPTTNCVLTFSSLDERNLWWHCLEKHIDAQRDKEELKTLSVRVINKENKENKTTAQAEQTQLTLQVGLTDTAKKLLGICVEKFSLEETDVNEYQLWVRSSKEAAMYPLIGHELPYAIKMSHLRDVLAKYDDLLYPEDEDQVLSFAEKELPEHKCQFILRRAGKTHVGISIDTSGVQKRFRKAKKSPFKLSFKRSMSTKAEGSISPSGKLFGMALPLLCPDNSLPKPVTDLITTLYNNGPFFTGIFRKSGNARVCREVKAKIDAGEDVCFDELPLAVSAALFKEFLRNLPDSIFICDLYENWINTNEVEDVMQRIEAIKSLLDRLPPSHVMLLNHVFCMLHYIDLHNDENSMNAYNLSICVAPSMIWPPLSAGAMAQATATKKAPSLVEFMIRHTTDIFGEEVITVFGDPPIRKEGTDHESSGDSDSMNSGHDPSSLKRDDSSLESIERELYDNDLSPSPRSMHWPGQLLSPSTLSRDSGLTSSNNDLYPESEASDTTDSGVESKKETSGSNSSMGSQTGLRHSRSAGYVRDGMDIGFHDGRTSSPSLRVRRGSEPPEVAYKGKKIVVRTSRSAGVTVENSPDTSDNEVEISPETFKMLQDLNQESSLKLFSEIGIAEHFDRHQPSPRGLLPNAHGHSYSRVSSRDNESVRPKTNNSTRVPIWHTPSSSSSSEGLFPVQAMPQNSKHDLNRQISSGKIQRGLPVTERPKTLAIRPTTSSGAQPKHTMNPPREFFPRDATQTSLQNSPKQGVMKSQSDHHIHERRRQQRDSERERIMQQLSPIPDPQQRSTPPSYQEAMNRRALFHRHTSVDSVGLKINPNKTQWNNRARQPVRSKGSESRPVKSSRAPLRTALSQDDTRTFFPHDDSHLVESGIIYYSSDSESSDAEAVDIESLKLHKSHPVSLLHGLRVPSVRRTSSDRTESRDRRVANLRNSQDSIQRSNSDRCSPLDSPTKTPIFFARDTTLKSPTPVTGGSDSKSSRPQPTRRITSPTVDRRHVGLTTGKPPPIRRSVSAEERSEHNEVGRCISNNSTTSTDSGLSPRTALHFPFPDPHAEPPKSPSSQPKSSVREVDSKGDRVSELRSDEEFKQKILQAKRNWQKHKQLGSTDSGTCVEEDLDSIEFTEESYV